MKLRRQIKLGMICEGYLEEVGVNRVKIYVQFCGTPDYGLTAGGFAPSYQWDVPDNWEVVE